MHLSQPECFDLDVPAERTEWLLSVGRIDKCKDEFQTDSAPDWAIIILHPRLGGGEVERGR